MKLCLVGAGVLAAALLASDAAQSQDIGPGPFTSSVSMGASRTVLGSTQWTPPSGSVAAHVDGPGTLTFDPAAGSTPGPITVSTVNASAIVITGSGQLAINPNGSPFPTTITTTGPNAYGIDIISGQHTELLNNVVIATSGQNSDGIRIQNPNNVDNATNVTVTATGAGASALALISGGGSTANFTNSSLTSEAGPAIRVEGGSSKTISLTDTNVAAGSGDGRWLYVTGGSTNTNITASGSMLTGAAITDTGSTSNLAVTNGTLWNLTGNSNVTNLTNNGSMIEFAAPVGGVFKTLTTVNYGGAGGTIGFNTYLGADGSPSDLLVINGGTATGSTNLRIGNAAGPGDYTTGNGIRVVDAINGGTTAGSAFALTGEVRAGFFDYRLYRGGFNGSDPDDWFLRSTFNGGNGNGNGGNGNGGGGNGNGNGGNGAGNGGGNGGNGNAGNGPVTPPGVLPSDPAPDNGAPPPGIWPIIGPELATYGVVQPIARQMALTTLGTLHERVGDAAADATCPSATFAGVAITKAPPAVEVNCRSAVWGRLFGQQINNRYQAFTDPRANGQVAGIQTGIDVWRGSLIAGHSDTAGLYFAYGNGNVSVDGLLTNAAATAYILQHTGSLNLNVYSVGGYWTHYGPSGWYIDAVLQGSFYQGNASTQFANLPTNGTGFTSSLEAGYPIPLPWFGPRFVLEPEGQIIWQRVTFDNATDGLGPVGLGTTTGASGRLGLRGKWTISDPAGRVWQPYVLANVWRDWGAGANTTFGSDAVLLSEQATRLEFAGGFSAKILPGLSLYAQAGYQFATSGDQRRDGVKGDFGVHYTW